MTHTLFCFFEILGHLFNVFISDGFVINFKMMMKFNPEFFFINQFGCCLTDLILCVPTVRTRSVWQIICRSDKIYNNPHQNLKCDDVTVWTWTTFCVYSGFPSLSSPLLLFKSSQEKKKIRKKNFEFILNRKIKKKLLKLHCGGQQSASVMVRKRRRRRTGFSLLFFFVVSLGPFVFDYWTCTTTQPAFKIDKVFRSRWKTLSCRRGEHHQQFPFFFFFFFFWELFFFFLKKGRKRMYCWKLLFYISLDPSSSAHKHWKNGQREDSKWRKKRRISTKTKRANRPQFRSYSSCTHQCEKGIAPIIYHIRIERVKQ